MAVHFISDRIDQAVINFTDNKLSFKSGDHYYCEDIIILDNNPVPDEPVLKLDVSLQGSSSPMLCRVNSVKEIIGLDLITDEQAKKKYQHMLDVTERCKFQGIPIINERCNYFGIDCDQQHNLQPMTDAALYIVNGQIIADFTTTVARFSSSTVLQNRLIGVAVDHLEIFGDKLYLVPENTGKSGTWFWVTSMLHDHKCEDDFIDQLTPGKDTIFREKLISLIIDLSDENNGKLID